MDHPFMQFLCHICIRPGKGGMQMGNAQKEIPVKSLCRTLQGIAGGEYWARTSDLPRVRRTL